MGDTGLALHGLSAFVQALNPDGIEEFLKARGWTAEDEMAGRWRLWYSKDRRACFMVPADKKFYDYGVRVAEGLVNISASEGRHILGILWEMLPQAMRPELLKAVFPAAPAAPSEGKEPPK